MAQASHAPRLLLAVPTNEPFLRCVGGPSMNDSLSTEVRSLTSFQSGELSLMNPVRPGSALRCGKTCVLARGTTQSSTWYNTCVDEKPSVALLARQATTGVRNSPANGWEGEIEYENQMQFSNRVVKG